jgi:hypothetical protein
MTQLCLGRYSNLVCAVLSICFVAIMENRGSIEVAKERRLELLK